MVDRSDQDVPRSVAAFAERLSDRVRTALPRWEWTYRPERRSSHEELQQSLAEKGIPEWPFLWPLEEAFGGVEVRLAWEDLRFGITPEHGEIMAANWGDEQNRPRFVRIANWGNDELLVDAVGRVYSLHDSGALTAIDVSFEALLEHQAMNDTLVDWSPMLLQLSIFPNTIVRSLAESRAMPQVAAASNQFHLWWRDDSLTLFEWGELSEQEPRGALWAKTLGDLVRAIDAAAQRCPALEVKPVPIYDDAHREVLPVEELRARAPSAESLRTRAGARRFPLIGEPSIHEGKPPSTGDVWISGEGDTLRIDVLEQREGNVVNYWKVTPTGSHALLTSLYGKG